MTELWRLSATELAARVRARDVSAAEAARDALARLDAANPAFQNNLVRTNAASSATCNGRGMYLGGYEDVNTDTVHDAHAYLPTPGVVTYDIATRTWANASIISAPSRQPATAPSSPAIMPCSRNRRWMSPSVKPSDFRIAMSRVFSYTTVEMML